LLDVSVLMQADTAAVAGRKLPGVEQLGDVIGRRCRELGLSQTALADQVGVHVRQIRRYERGEQQPVLGVAVRLAATLGISLDELAGVAGPRLALDGEWWAARQMLLDGHDVVAALPLTLTQSGATVTARARGAATWQGELRLSTGPVLTGWYAGTAAGTMFFLLREQDDELVGAGRWVGLSSDGAVVTGHAALARSREAAQLVIASLTA
jgi:transcriptional regulator with XRE-family HTH domain